MPQATSAFRSDIDGLRAFAVLAVIVHHVAPGALPGGFAGVDVFFVISGFLVTRLIDDDLHAGRFHYLEFIWKRCRRIVPALVALLLGTLLLGACVLTGPEFVSLARHTVAASASASNLLLYSEVGYFDSAAALKPLLHLWSLGVEEQFYLLWPLLLSLLPVQPRARLLAVGAVALGSLLASENLAYSDPAQAFYLLHSRAWELGAGGLLALSLPMLHAQVIRFSTYIPSLRTAASLVGSALLLFTVTTLHAEHTWPGLAAMPAVLGTVLVIAAGPLAPLNASLLSSRVAGWIGQRSYALYLWHWPPLAMLHIIAQERGWSVGQSLWTSLGIMLPVVVMAHVTYRWVEQPVRRRQVSMTSARVIRTRQLAPYVGALAASAVVAVAVIAAHGFPSRYGSRSGIDATAVLRDASADSITAYDRIASRCDLDDAGTATWCWRVAGEGRGVAVIGDSHAEVVFAGLVAAHAGAPLLLTGRKGCAPLVQHQPIADRLAEICRRATLIAHEAVRSDRTIGTVLIVARGPAYITGTGFGIDSLRPVVPVTLGLTAHDTLALRTAYELGMERAIQSFHAAGKRVVLVTGVPEIGFLPEECVVGRPLGLRMPRTPCAIPRSAVDARNAGYRSLVRQLAVRNPTLELFDATPLFCDATLCHAEQATRLLYQDGNHLTLAGSRIVATALMPKVRLSGVARLDR